MCVGEVVQSEEKKMEQSVLKLAESGGADGDGVAILYNR